jgi:Ca2+-binding EF-hand superfamily protein
MRRFLLLLAVSICAGSNLTARAEDNGKTVTKPSDDIDPDRMVDRLLKRFDTDKDGKISKDEAKGKLAENFDRIDTNKDGYLDKDELHRMAVVVLAMRAKNSAKPANAESTSKPGDTKKPAEDAEVERMVTNMLERFDTDKDGRISKDEAKGRLAENFERIDTNKDGYLDKDELRRMAARMVAAGVGKGNGQNPAAPRNSKDFDDLDKNADGRLTRDELQGTPYADHFDEIDTNKDGKIDRKEFEAYLKLVADKK